MFLSILKLRRESLGLTQAEVALFVGVANQTILKWENGHSEPSASKIKLLSKKLQMSTDEICNNITFYSPSKIDFMSEVAPFLNKLDDVNFTMVLFDNIPDKSKFIEDLHLTLADN